MYIQNQTDSGIGIVSQTVHHQVSVSMRLYPSFWLKRVNYHAFCNLISFLLVGSRFLFFDCCGSPTTKSHKKDFSLYNRLASTLNKHQCILNKLKLYCPIACYSEHNRLTYHMEVHIIFQHRKHKRSKTGLKGKHHKYHQNKN
jgi:hypothetical protein